MPCYMPTAKGTPFASPTWCGHPLTKLLCASYLITPVTNVQYIHWHAMESHQLRKVLLCHTVVQRINKAYALFMARYQSQVTHTVSGRSTLLLIRSHHPNSLKHDISDDMLLGPSYTAPETFIRDFVTELLLS